MDVLRSFFEPVDDHGDWRAEYRALLDRCVLAGRPDRCTVRVVGDRRVEMLNGLVTQELRDLSGCGRYALLLTNKGRLLTDLRALPRGQEMLLDVPRAGLQNLLEAFTKYLPPIYATFEDVSAELRLVGLYGPEAAAAARQLFGAGLPEGDLQLAEVEFEGAPLLLVRDRWLAGDAVEIIAPDSALAALADGLMPALIERGGRPAGMRALEVAQVEWGVPRYGIDMSEENLAQETGLEARAISYDKGCYLGQEVVARIHFRGHVNRRLRGLRFRGRPPGRGATLVESGKEIGIVTTAVDSPELGPIGLGYIRREIVPSDVVSWREDGREGLATVTELPFRTASV